MFLSVLVRSVPAAVPDGLCEREIQTSPGVRQTLCVPRSVPHSKRDQENSDGTSRGLRAFILLMNQIATWNSCKLGEVVKNTGMAAARSAKNPDTLLKNKAI